MPPLPAGLSTPGAQLAPGGRIPPPRSSVAIRCSPDWVNSASWLKSMSWVRVEGGRRRAAGAAALVVDAADPAHARRGRGRPTRASAGTSRSCSPAPVPSTQSMTMAPVSNGADRGARPHLAGQRRAARRVVAEVVGRPVVVEGAGHVEDDQRVAAAAGQPVVGVDLELVAGVDPWSRLAACGRAPSRRSGSGSGRPRAGRRRACASTVVPGREVHAGGDVDDLEAVEVERPSPPRADPRSRAAPSSVDGDAVRGHRVDDVRALGVDVDRVRLADVADQPDLDRVGDVGDVDDLKPALRRVLRGRAGPGRGSGPPASVASISSWASSRTGEAGCAC